MGASRGAGDSKDRETSFSTDRLNQHNERGVRIFGPRFVLRRVQSSRPPVSRYLAQLFTLTQIGCVIYRSLTERSVYP